MNWERDHLILASRNRQRVWFALFGLSFTLECATAALTVGYQKRLGLQSKT